MAKRPKTPKSQLPKPSKMPSGWSDFRAALAVFRANWLLYTLIILVVTLPSDLIGLSPTFSGDSMVVAVTQIAALFMNLAVLWAVIQRTNGHNVTFGQAYYDGTSALLRFILAGLTVVGMLIFVAIGIAVYNLSLVSVDALPAYSPEQLLIGFVCALISLPSLFFVVRFGLAYIGVVYDDLRPVAALRRSWRLTRRRFWVVFGRGVQLLVYMALVAIPPSLIAAGLGLLRAGNWAVFVFQVLISILALPIGNAYLVRLYQHLKQTVPDEFLNPPARTELFDNEPV